MIEEYKFGTITINGKTYNYDVEVRWMPQEENVYQFEILKWWRKEGHIIDIVDVERAVKENPDVIVIGTGSMGVAKVTKECEVFIKQKGIRLIIDRTEEAVRTFNIILEEAEEEKGKKEKLIGLFHLTC